MVDGICTRCSEPTVYHSRPTGDESQLSLVIPQNDRVLSMQIEGFHVQTYLCGSCGYLEQRAALYGKTTGASLLDTLAASESKHWRRVEPES